MLSRAVRGRSQVTRRASVTSMPAHQRTVTNTREVGPVAAPVAVRRPSTPAPKYQLERNGLDPATNIDETVDALSDLVCEGNVRAIGASSWASDSHFWAAPTCQNCRPTRCICLTGVQSHTHPEVHTVARLDVDGKPLRLLLTPNAARQARKA